MGNFFSRFKSNESTKDILAKLHSEIEKIEDSKWIGLRNQSHSIIFAVLVLAIFYLGFYFYANLYLLPQPKNKLVSISIFFIIFLFLAYFLIKGLQFYYQNKISNLEDKLVQLRRKKRKILDTIMEKETYKVAKELIEKYDPSMLKEKTPENLSNNSVLRQRIQTSSPIFNSEKLPNVDARSVRLIRPSASKPPLNVSMASNMSNIQPMSTIKSNVNPMPINPQFVRPFPIPPSANRNSLVRPICSQERSVLEKLVDYVIGDGPNNRFALICKFCHSHNGMALRNEFDYLNFKCCFCNGFNPARKQKPLAPRLNTNDITITNDFKSPIDETFNETNNKTDNIEKFKLEDDSIDIKNTSDSSDSKTDDSMAINDEMKKFENKFSSTIKDSNEIGHVESIVKNNLADVEEKLDDLKL